MQLPRCYSQNRLRKKQWQSPMGKSWQEVLEEVVLEMEVVEQVALEMVGKVALEMGVWAQVLDKCHI